MDRMTFKGFPYDDSYIKKLQAYEDTGLEPEEIVRQSEKLKLIDFNQRIKPDRLAEIAKAEYEGRLIALPCKVGDTVWFNTYKNNATKCIGIQPHEVKQVNVQFLTDGAEIPQWEIGKTVFLTREEAERALEEEQGWANF